MIKDLPDEDDAPVRVSYHSAPVNDPLDDEEPESPTESSLDDKEEPEEKKTPVTTNLKSKLTDDPDPLDEEDDDEEDPKQETTSEAEEEEDKEPDLEPDSDPDPEPQPEEKHFSAEIAGSSPSDADHDLYYLQTVKAGEQPEWPMPKENLNVFSQPIDAGLMQYWAYPKDSGKGAEDLPNAEVVAGKNKSDNPVIIIDQVKDHLTPGCCLELILAKNGHALAKTDSNLDNLEANITSLIDLAKINFGITAEHFISTGNVSPDVEKRLNDLEDAGGREGSSETEHPSENQSVSTSRINQTSFPSDEPILEPKGERSRWVVFIPVLILIIIAGLVFFYKDKLLSKVMNLTNFGKEEIQVTPTPIPTPTPTPTISVDRSKFTLRVLNGTPTTGAAGTLADKLKAKGWLIDKTGNATSSAVAESYVRGKPGTDDAIKVLIDDVSDYQASSSSSSLKSNDKADLEFVIGKK